MTESPFINELIGERILREAHRTLLRVVRVRFPTAVTPDLKQAIAEQSSRATLDSWLDAAATSATAEDFLAVLRR